MKKTTRCLLSLTLLATMLIMLAVTGSAATVRWSDSSGQHSITVNVNASTSETKYVRIPGLPTTYHTYGYPEAMEVDDSMTFSVSLHASYERSMCANTYLVQAIQEAGLQTKYTVTGSVAEFTYRDIYYKEPTGTYAYFKTFKTRSGDWVSYNGWLYSLTGMEQVDVNAFTPEGGEIFYAPYWAGTEKIMRVS